MASPDDAARAQPANDDVLWEGPAWTLVDDWPLDVGPDELVRVVRATDQPSEDRDDEIESLRAELADRESEHAASSRIASAMAEAVGWRTPGETWVDKAAYLQPLAAELMGKRELRDAREGIDPEEGLRPDWAVHPGEMLEEELEERGMTQTALAEALGHSLKHVNGVCRGHVRIEAPLAVRLERALGTSAEMWLRMQMAYDLHHARAADQPTEVAGDE